MTFRTIRYETRFDLELASIDRSRDRIGEAFQAVEWGLARKPAEAGIESRSNPGIWATTTRGSGFLAAPLVVFYSFDDELRDRIRDISLDGELRQDIEAAEAECQLKHESIVRPQ